jgi:hypothetical protein
VRYSSFAAADLDLEQFFIARRATLEALAADETRGSGLLVLGHSRCSGYRKPEIRNRWAADLRFRVNGTNLRPINTT